MCCLCCCCRRYKLKAEQRRQAYAIRHPTTTSPTHFTSHIDSRRPSGSASVRVSMAGMSTIGSPTIEQQQRSNNGYGSTQLDIEPQYFSLKFGESPTASPMHSQQHVVVRRAIQQQQLNEPVNRAVPVDDHRRLSHYERYAHPHHHSLFKTWQDVSRFVDICLMTIAASIAVLSPIALFVIMPIISSNDHLIDTF